MSDTEFIWTKDKPESEGYYWHRWSMEHTPTIEKVTTADCGCLHIEFSAVSKRAGLWAGPIPEPRTR